MAQAGADQDHPAPAALGVVPLKQMSHFSSLQDLFFNIHMLGLGLLGPRGRGPRGCLDLAPRGAGVRVGAVGTGRQGLMVLMLRVLMLSTGKASEFVTSTLGSPP